MIALVDIDGVVADMLPAWIAKYNRDYNDTLTAADITEWSLHRLLKPECGDKIYDYLTRPDFYDDVQPMPVSLTAVQAMRRMGWRVVYLTAGFYPAKIEWMHKQGFLSGKNSKWQNAEDVVISFDKGLIRGDLMIDDHPKNLHSSTAAHKWLFDAAHNREETSFLRVRSWREIITRLELGGI